MYSKLRYLRQRKVAAAAALSASAYVNTDVPWGERDRQTDAQDSPLISIASDVKAKLQLFTQVKASQCESFPIHQTVPNKNKAAVLSRRATILLLNETSNPIQNLYANYSVSWNRYLGEGAFGAVHLATNKITGDKVALKKIPKKFTDDASFQNEVNALTRVRANGGHPHICSIREIFEDGKYYYLVLDLVSGGEMFEHLIKMGAYSEQDASRLVKEVADALTFLHGIGIVHGDLKPENLMLSTIRKEDSTIKLVDFGCALIRSEDTDSIQSRSRAAITPAYCPPEVLEEKDPITPQMDIWGLGIILYIMLTGLHPFDLDGNATDEDIERAIKQRKSPPLLNSPITAHLSASAIDVIEKCIQWDPSKRILAVELLEHPWVRGLTARENKMADASKKLSMFREFKTTLEAKVFADFCSWSDDNNVSRKTALVERAFQSFDSANKGFLTSKDFRRLTERKLSNYGEDNAPVDDDNNKLLSLSGFSNLLGENMVNRYFPRGHIMYREGEIGNHMYFINSGIIEVLTKDGTRARRHQGDFFGEGALLHPLKIRSATIHCVTPINAIEISREYFEKYLASSGLTLDLKEKDRTRKRNRAKTLLRLQKNLKPLKFKRGDVIYKEGDDAQGLFILEEGRVDVLVEGKRVFATKPGDIFGEHSLVFCRPRNTAAVCVSDSCIVQEMKARDFYEIYNSHQHIKTSLRELCYRREFQKALVKMTNKEFPSIHDLAGVFDAADLNKTGFLEIDKVTSVLKSFDPSLSEAEIKEVLNSLDLNESGRISFDEFKLIFGMNEARAASI